MKPSPMRDELFAILIALIICAFILLPVFIFIKPSLDQEITKHAERRCERDWGRSNIEYLFLDNVCYVKTEDGYLPDWIYIERIKK